MAKEALEDVAKRSQLMAQVIIPNNDRQCYLSSAGRAVCVGKAGVLVPDICEGRCNCLPSISHALEGDPWLDASRRTVRVVAKIGKGPPRNEVEEGEGDMQKVSTAMKDRLARAHSGGEEL